MSAAADRISGLQFSIESPAEGAVVERDVQVAGWCLARQGAARAIRVCAADRTLELPVESLRPDVAAAYPYVVRSALSGFSASLTLAPGSYDLAIEARFDDGDWQSLGSRSIVVGRTPLRASLDTPPGLWAAHGTVRFSGWCVHPQRLIADLHLAVGAARVACQYGLERPDVARQSKRRARHARGSRPAST